MIKKHKQNKSRLECAKIRLEGLKDNINKGYGIKETDRETIEGMTYSKNVDGMPGSPSNDSKVERIVTTYREEQDRLRKPKSGDMFDEKRMLEEKIKRLQYEVDLVEAMLRALTTDERYIVEMKLIEEMSWQSLVKSYMEENKMYKDERTLRRIKKQAIDKMENVLKVS